MTTQTRFTLIPEKRTVPLLAMGTMLLLAVIQHVVVLNVVLPALGGFLMWEVPSRTGGTSSLLNPGEFTTLSLSFMAVMGVLFIVTAILIRLNKGAGALLAAFLFFAVTLIFFLLSFGNIFGDLWNGWASAGGVVLAFVIVFASELWMTKGFNINGRASK